MRQRILALMIKEFLALLKDKRSRMVVFIPPIIQLLVFGYAATFDLNRIPFAVYNEDSGLASRDLVARFAGSPNFRQVATLTHEEEIAPLVDAKRVLLVLHLGPTFSRDLWSGRSAPVQLMVDGRNSNTAAILLNYVNTIVAAFNTDWQQSTGSPRGAGADDSTGQATAQAHLEARAWFNPNLVSRWFIVPGIVGLLTLVVTTLVTALSVAREREQGTFDQLLVTPFRPGEILLGKALPGFIIGLFEATLIILIAVLWFQVPLRGSLLTLYVGLLCFLLSTVGMGLMISSLAVTQQQGLLGAFLFLVPCIILSGFATPIANMPHWVQMITYVDPLRYFLIILRGVFLEGTPFHLLLDQFWPMAIIGVVNLFLAGYLFRHRLY
ncbi:MAG TPA: ABC transporter permease [Verrucomicrobiae bacterium]|nr:ABC transporter permease [Verrucomicrobiae bacterium]